MDDISRIGVTIDVNHTKNCITVKESNPRRKIAQIPNVNSMSVADACREAAFYFLLRASEQEGSLSHVRDQVKVMCEEHRMYNEEKFEM